MDKKTTIIVAVVAVVVVVVAAVAVVMMNNNNDSKDYNAQELAKDFVDNYHGVFGTFKIADGGSANEAEMTYTATQQNWKGEALDATRAMNIKIVHCETEAIAATEFDKYLTVSDAPYNSKNGSTAGNTIVNKIDKLGMADKHVTVLNGTKNIKLGDVPETTTVKTVKASDYGADQIYVLYASYHQPKADKQQYSQFSMVLLDGKNLIIINQSSKDEFSMYYNLAIKDESETQADEVFVTVAQFEEDLVKFCKAF
jgi:hypothetical protein